MLFIIASLAIVSCNKEDEPINDKGSDELPQGLSLHSSVNEGNYQINLYAFTKELQVGYNELYVEINDKDGSALNPASLQWEPMMTMDMGNMIHTHSCPYSQLSKPDGYDFLYNGNIVFIMESDGHHHYWEITIDFVIEDKEYSVTMMPEVTSVETDYKKAFTSINGNDGEMYFLALIEPSSPQVGANEMVAAIYKKETDTAFPIADNLTIRIDPRMPGMGNHGAPGNEDLVQGSDGYYHGKVGFSMSGYWKVNMVMEDSHGDILAGQFIDEETEESTLNFKIEF